MTNASRAIKDSELETCAANGVKDVTEVKVGFDGIVFANSKSAEPVSLTIPQIWMALAKEVPVDGEIKANPYTMWNEIDESLPAAKIEVLGPPPTSGTRDAFVELVMETGCEAFPEVDQFVKGHIDRDLLEGDRHVETVLNRWLLTNGDSREPEMAGIGVPWSVPFT